MNESESRNARRKNDQIFRILVNSGSSVCNKNWTHEKQKQKDGSGLKSCEQVIAS